MALNNNRKQKISVHSSFYFFYFNFKYPTSQGFLFLLFGRINEKIFKFICLFVIRSYNRDAGQLNNVIKNCILH